MNRNPDLERVERWLAKVLDDAPDSVRDDVLFCTRAQMRIVGAAAMEAFKDKCGSGSDTKETT